ncbi:MAG: glycosyltransferase family 39 protein [Lachnospiraceae bacterium]|nr:glycosyltransferase family 39 protein [Lachnospiraceae bacterium]
MDTFLNLIKKSIFGIVFWGFACAIGFLFLTSFIGSCYVDYQEKTYYKYDPFWLPIVSCVLFLLVIIGVMKKRRICNIGINKIILKILTVGGDLTYMLVLLEIVIKLEIIPRADQAEINRIARVMTQGDYSDFFSGGYMDKYPNQLGIVFLFYLMYKSVHKITVPMYFINVLSVVVIMYAMGVIGKKITKKQMQKVCTIIVALFFPLALYATFVYGNLLGMAFSTVGIVYVLYFFEKHQMRYAIISIFFSVMAVVIKQNFIIPMIGIIVILCLDYLQNKNKKSIIFILGLVLVSVIFSQGVKWQMRKITGSEINGGIPSVAWVVMGLQEGELAPGWYNSYNVKVYEESGFDTKIAKKKASDKLKEELVKMAQNPMDALQFFIKKNMSQWSNPTFECFWINNDKIREGEHKEIKERGWLKSLTTEPGNNVLTIYLNIFQNLIYGGCVCWCIFSRKQKSLEEMIILTIFIGGFVFHTFWEAKCQYTMPYYVMLFPIALKGITLFGNEIKQMQKSEVDYGKEKNKLD